VIEIDHRTERQRRRAIQQCDAHAIAILRPPSGLRATADVGSDDARNCQRLLTMRGVVQHRAAECPPDPPRRAATSTWHVVERPIHQRGESLGNALLDDELTDVRRGTLPVSTPSARPFNGLIAELIQTGVSETLDGSVRQVAAESVEASRGIRTNARLRAKATYSERRQKNGGENGDRMSCAMRHHRRIEASDAPAQASTRCITTLAAGAKRKYSAPC